MKKTTATVMLKTIINGDRFQINSPILRQRYGLKFSLHLYLTHLTLVFFNQFG